MTTVFLNIVFGAISVLVAVGIPFAGLAWQRSERRANVGTALDPAEQRRPDVAGYRGPNAPVPDSWVAEQDANERTLTRA